METQSTYTKGDRVRLLCSCPGAQAGDEGRVVSVQQPASESSEVITVLIDTDPATTHGITAFAHEIEHTT